MKQEHKLYATIGAAIALSIAVYVVMGERGEASQARTVSASAEALPTVKLSKEEAEKVTKFVLKNKDKGEVTLEKKGDAWMVTKPISAKANDQNVKSIVENLEKIELSAVIGNDAAIHEKYELSGDKAVHVQAFKGDEKVIDMYFGKSGSRGQMARMGGDGATPTVYATKGYSAYLWGREIKNWRHNEVLKFEDGNAIATEVENENGKFSFTKADDKWTASFYARNDKGELADKGVDIEEFDESKVKDMLRAFKNLKATDFAQEKDDTGVDDAIKNGGIIRVTMKDEDKPKYVLNVGKAQEGSNRYLKVDGDETVYVVTSWAGDWAGAKPEKFKKAAEKEEGADGEDLDGADKDGEDLDGADKDGEDLDGPKKKGPAKGPAKGAGKGDGKGDGKGEGKGAPKPADKAAPKAPEGK